MCVIIIDVLPEISKKFRGKVIEVVYFLMLIFLEMNQIKRKRRESLVEIIVYGLLIGGILGNLIDRILYGKVVDYLDINISYLESRIKKG